MSTLAEVEAVKELRDEELKELKKTHKETADILGKDKVIAHAIAKVDALVDCSVDVAVGLVCNLLHPSGGFGDLRRHPSHYLVLLFLSAMSFA